jgi:hypothetical protein
MLGKTRSALTCARIFCAMPVTAGLMLHELTDVAAIAIVGTTVAELLL